MSNLTNKLATSEFSSPNLEVTAEQSQRAYLNILEDMQADRTVMEEQRIATFNIMEDITEAQDELKKRFSELDILKDLVQALGSSVKTSVVLDLLIGSLKQILPDNTNFMYVLPPTDPGRGANIVYTHAYTPLSAKYLEAVKENIIYSFDLLHTRIKKRSELVRWVRGTLIFEFVAGTKDDGDTALPLSIFSIPFVVDYELMGVLIISSPRPGIFTDRDVKISNTMVGAAASTISRLQHLLESEQTRLKSLVQSLSNGVIMFDLDQRVTMSNPVAQKMTGLPEKGFFLSELTKLFTSAAAAAAAAADKALLVTFDARILQTLQTGEVTHIAEVELAHFVYEVWVNPVVDVEKKIVGGAIVLHDITHITEVEHMKNEFISVASHQLRTPMAGIQWVAERLLKKEKLSDKGKEYLGDIHTSVQRLTSLVDLLLNVSRIESGDVGIVPKPFGLIEFTKNYLDETSPLCAKKNITLTFDKHPETLKVISDTSALRNIVQSLVSNSIEYTPEGGSIEVSVEEIPDDKFRIMVKDTGIGIPKGEQAGIFTKFTRATNARKVKTDGTGLGLHIAFEATKMLDGKIWFESEGEGKGTTFFVELPKTAKERTGTKSLA